MINLTEDEMLLMSSAIVEAYIMDGAKLEATIYTEPGMQNAATKTYPISAEIYEQIVNNPNVVEEAKRSLAQRYNDNQVNQRNNRINATLQGYIDGRDSIVNSGFSQEIQNIKQLREEYVTSLEGTGMVGYSEE